MLEIEVTYETVTTTLPAFSSVHPGGVIDLEKLISANYIKYANVYMIEAVFKKDGTVIHRAHFGAWGEQYSPQALDAYIKGCIDLELCKLPIGSSGLSPKKIDRWVIE